MTTHDPPVPASDMHEKSEIASRWCARYSGSLEMMGRSDTYRVIVGDGGGEMCEG